MSSEPLPPEEISISNIETNIAVLVVTPPQGSKYDLFSASINNGGTVSTVNQHSEGQYQAQITQLQAGTQYTVTVVTVSGTSLSVRSESDEKTNEFYTSRIFYIVN